MFITALYNLKGGVGKTAACVNFAYMAAKDGYKVLLWDLDPQGASSFYFKAKPQGKSTIKKIMENEMSIEDAILNTDYENLEIIPADFSARKLDVLLDEHKGTKKQLKNIMKQLQQYDFVFMDCPPGFSNLADNIFNAADIILMPVIPTTLSERTYEMVKDHLEEKSAVDKLMCFFSMADVRKNMHNEIMQDLVKDKRFFEYYIPNLSDIEKMGIRHAPIESFAPSSYAAACYRALWNEIKEGVLQ
jgi:cellulose biosynthesis protein BcsQ